MSSLSKDHTSLQYVDTLRQICHPLFKAFGLSYFTFVRQFNCRDRICLTTGDQWHAHFCREKRFLSDIFELPAGYYNDGYFLWELLKDTTLYNEAREHFNIDHKLTLITKGANYTDFYHFGTPKTESQTESLPQDIILANLDRFKYFTVYFQDKCHVLIAQSDMIELPELKNEHPKNINAKLSLFSRWDDFVSGLNIRRYYLGDAFDHQYLTPKEFECVRLAIRGLSAAAIAQKLSRSQKTVEVHMARVRAKLNCNKTSGVVFRLMQSSLASILFIEP